MNDTVIATEPKAWLDFRGGPGDDRFDMRAASRSEVFGGKGRDQVIGSPEQVESGAAGGAGGASGDEDADAGGAIPDDDVELVAARTGASEDDARAALEDVDGDLAAAVESLE